MEPEDILAAPAVWLIGFVLLGALARRLPRRYAVGVLVGYAAHIASTVAQVQLTRHYFEGGDMFLYSLEGDSISDLLRIDFGRFFPEVIKLILQQDYQLPVRLVASGATVSMAGISGLLLFVTGGSLYAALGIIAIVSCVGKLALFQALRAVSAPAQHALLGAIMLLPSGVYWSSGLLKESIAIGPLCLMVAMLHRLSRRISIGPAITLGVAAILVGVSKPYILFAFALGSGVLFYVQRSSRAGFLTIKPQYLLAGAALAIGAIAWLGTVFPEYDVRNMGENVAQLQAAGQTVDGGSNYTIGDAGERSLLGQFAFAPVALITSLFRPFLFEVHNAVSLVSAIEATFILALALRALFRNRVRGILQQTVNTPIFAFSLAFTLAFALAVGLATTNMGTLSRYRMPLLPFWMTLLVVWNRDLFERRTTARATAPRQARVRPTAPMARPVETPRDT